ncbi:MAG: UDP-N-acetylmuramoyl-tripeptide--D-alanyl-D-alanine ligase [Mycobacteriales bacterium]
MIELSLAEIADITSARVHGVTAEDADRIRVTGSVEFDSRAVTQGGLFVAIVGERVDGHDFAGAAFAAGAVAVLGVRPVEGPSLVVGDPLAALAALAAAVARRLPELTVIGITASSGKTSTKDLLASVVERLGPTVAPPGSFNNELGHPYTVLRCDERTRYLILEKSARGVGHITELTRIAPPRIGAVLNVGRAHVGEFGSIEVTARAKGELVEALPPAGSGGVAVLNADDPLVAAMADRTRARVVRFGVGPRREDADPIDVTASNVVLDGTGRPRYTLHTPAGAVDIALRLHGEHQVSNSLAVATIALELGMSMSALADALSEAVPRSGGRMQVIRRDDAVTIIDDSYNANPDSMRAGLSALSAMRAPVTSHSPEAGTPSPGSGRLWAVLGYMGELGPAERAEHAALGFTVTSLGIDRLVVVGDEAQAIHTAAIARAEAWQGSSELVSDTDAALALLHSQLRPGDVVLVKASRSVRLERIVRGLLDVPQALNASQTTETDLHTLMSNKEGTA